MTEQRYEPGKKASFRPTKDLPRYFYEYLNENDVGNRELLELLLLGIQTKMAGENRGIFLPFFDLPPERREEIASNDELLKTIVKVAEWIIYDRSQPPFKVWIPEQQEGQEAKGEGNDEPPAEDGKDIDVSENSYVTRYMQLIEDEDDDED